MNYGPRIFTYTLKFVTIPHNTQFMFKYSCLPYAEYLSWGVYRGNGVHSNLFVLILYNFIFYANFIYFFIYLTSLLS